MKLPFEVVEMIMKQVFWQRFKDYIIYDTPLDDWAYVQKKHALILEDVENDLMQFYSGLAIYATLIDSMIMNYAVIRIHKDPLRLELAASAFYKKDDVKPTLFFIGSFNKDQKELLKNYISVAFESPIKFLDS